MSTTVRTADPLANLVAAFDRYQHDGDLAGLLEACVMEGWLSGQVTAGDHQPLILLCRERVGEVIQRVHASGEMEGPK